MKETLEFFTEAELTDRIWDREQIEEVMAKRAMLAANEQRRKEITDLWVSEDANIASASYGKNWGYYIGIESIIQYYVVGHHEKMMDSLSRCAAADPKISVSPENMGFGYMSIYPVTTPLIKIAGDGKTAKGIWYTIGQVTERQPDGTGDAVWHCVKIGVDFAKEHDGWKIWHLVEVSDVYCRAGEDYRQQPVIMEPDDPSLAEVKAEFGQPDYPLLTHDSRFNWADDYPPMPKEYYSFSDETSYGPKGHPNYKEVWQH